MEKIMRPPRPITKDQEDSLKQLLKKTKTKADFRRVQCLWLRARFGLSSYEVSDAVSWSSGAVRRIQASYFKEGESSLIRIGRGGRRNENLRVSEESEFLSSFLDKAKAGHILVISEIKAAYEKKIGHKVPKSTVYRMLTRNGWRKIAPRPHHLRADKEKQEAFKKNSRK
jgi:transposase